MVELGEGGERRQRGARPGRRRERAANIEPEAFGFAVVDEQCDALRARELLERLGAVRGRERRGVPTLPAREQRHREQVAIGARDEHAAARRLRLGCGRWQKCSERVYIAA